MKTITRSAITGIAIAALAAGTAATAAAHGTMPPSTSPPASKPASTAAASKANISVSKAMVRMVPPGTANTAAYMNIRSRGTADTLLRASVPRSVAMKTELHRSMMVDGQMKMVQQKSISIPRNGTRVLKMGGFHVMIMGLRRDLAAGTRIPITLTFRTAGTVRVNAPVVEM